MQWRAGQFFPIQFVFFLIGKHFFNNVDGKNFYCLLRRAYLMLYKMHAFSAE